MANDKVPSLSTVPDQAPAPGKGEVPPPTAATKVIVGTGAAAPLAAGGGFWDWVSAHPWETATIGAAVAVVVCGAVYLLNNWRRRRQDAAVPETPLVPELAAA